MLRCYKSLHRNHPRENNAGPLGSGAVHLSFTRSLVPSFHKIIETAGSPTRTGITIFGDGVLFGFGFLQILVSYWRSNQYYSAVLGMHNLTVKVGRMNSHCNLSYEGQQLFYGGYKSPVTFLYPNQCFCFRHGLPEEMQTECPPLRSQHHSLGR